MTRYISVKTNFFNSQQKMKIGPENDETDARADKFDNF